MAAGNQISKPKGPAPEPDSWGGPVKQRLAVVGGVFIYVACFQWVYIHYLYQTFDYFGFDYYPPATRYLALGWVLSLLPSLWIPIKLTRASQLAYWVLYLTAIIPSMWVPLYVGLNPSPEIALVMLTLFAGFAILGTVYLVPVIPLGPARMRPENFWKLYAALGLAMALWIIIVFRSNLAVVSFWQVYELRDVASEMAEGNPVNYAFMLLTGAIAPFLIAWGLYHRRALLYVAGCLGQVLAYMAGGAKGSLLSIVFISGLYVLLTRKQQYPFAVKLMAAIVALVLGTVVTYLVAGVEATPESAPILFMAVSLVFMRTFGIGGLMTAQYYDFFQRNPQTLYSHIKGVSSFVQYPYANAIGLEIGSFYTGNPMQDSTAHFWATDGLAAMGLPGVLLISVFCALVFWAIDCVADRHGSRLGALIICFAAFNIANISLFTSLLSGGLALLIVFMYLAPGKPGPAAARFRMPARRRALGGTLPAPGSQ